MNVYRVFLLLTLCISVGAYRIYQDRIPNGDNIPHPCKPNYLWRGVGHMNPLGGGPRNIFGTHFGQYKKWLPDLCRMDSDGDGKTNGEELGDPNCVWTENSLPSNIKGITHPGICDPWGSPQCADRNKDISCNAGEFDCPAINDTGVLKVTLNFPETKVPAKETTYICMTFELDMLEPGVDYHLIATEPYIDNPYVMHHTVLTGCGAQSRALDKPEECLMGQAGCQETMSIWTLGLAGECVHPDAGFKIGTSGVKRLSMQHHWTNPELKTHYVDKSGMHLYLTKNLRKYNAAYFTTGEMNLIIPPGEDRVSFRSSCSSTCTQKKLKDNIYLMTGLNHMHYLGYHQNVEHHRRSEKLRDLTPDEEYSYDNPVVHMYSPPVEVRPGDNLETTCVYRSTSRKKTTFYGEGSYEEMCFGLFTFYPAENVIGSGSCLTYDDLELCQLSERFEVHGCSYEKLFNPNATLYKDTVQKVLDHCNYNGYCRKECPAVIAEVRRNPCFTGAMESATLNFAAAVESIELVRFQAAFRSCECSLDTPFTFPTAGVGSFVASWTTLVVFALSRIL